jgi:hypothetical protein
MKQTDGHLTVDSRALFSDPISKRSSIMRAVVKVGIVVCGFACAGATVAGIDVKLERLEQPQTGVLNRQYMNRGSAYGTWNYTKIELTDLIQIQTDGWNFQVMAIGNASDTMAFADVTANKVKQEQSGTFNYQSMAVGNVGPFGFTHVHAGEVNQTQTDVVNGQSMNIGNAK